jgi:large-conductance mechanosensitive channel
MTAKSRNPKPKHPQVLNPGSVIRMEAPKSSRNQPKAHIIVSAPEPVSGFKTFLREHAVVALAIGFVVATQIQALARQLIASFIDPAFKLLFGEKLSLRTFTLHFHGRTADFGYGSFIYALLDVLFVLITIYIAVRIFRLEDLGIPDKDKKKKRSAVENEEY